MRILNPIAPQCLDGGPAQALERATQGTRSVPARDRHYFLRLVPVGTLLPAEPQYLEAAGKTTARAVMEAVRAREAPGRLYLQGIARKLSLPRGEVERNLKSCPKL